MDSSTGNIDYLLSDVTVNGKFIIYVAGPRYGDTHVTYHDLKKNNITTFKLEDGWNSEEFKLHDGFGYGLNSGEFWEFTLCSSSNHIESLVSLKNITCSSLV